MSEMQSFTDYSTYAFDVSEQQLTDFDELVNKLVSSDKFRNFINIITDYKDHLSQSKAHLFDITLYDEELLSQMYVVYREKGYTGSIKDMLFSIAKTVKIGSIENGDYLGWSYITAVNVPGWTFLFQEHQEGQKHESLKYFNTSYFVNEPLYHFDGINGEILNSLDSGLILEYWNPSSSYIYFDTHFDRSIDELDIFEIEFLNMNIKVKLNGTTNCVDVFIDDDITVAHPFMQPDLTEGKFILSYTDGKLSVADALSETTTKITLPDNAIALHPKQIFNRNGLNTISYYTTLSEDTRIHLFN